MPRHARPTHRTPKTENPGAGGRGAMRRAHAPLKRYTDTKSDRIAILEDAMKRAIKIIDTNLYHQREKVVDAASILREALEK